jgi:hypothetical protein
MRSIVARAGKPSTANVRKSASTSGSPVLVSPSSARSFDRARARPDALHLAEVLESLVSYDFVGCQTNMAFGQRAAVVTSSPSAESPVFGDYASSVPVVGLVWVEPGR